MDHFAAQAEDTAQDERTHRFENAFYAAHARLFAEKRKAAEGQSALAALAAFPVDAVEVDVFEQEEFLAARLGEAHVRELRTVESELHAWRNGDYTGTFEAKRRRTVALEAHLEALRRR
ncbi:hypothetical protein [Nocardioides sp. GXZ039]|uniref:hypothetical protein n=1 Tax=Nocardioides sp. GXZ039 TaxID=3136018 RepID=UPI0030F4841D